MPPTATTCRRTFCCVVDRSHLLLDNPLFDRKKDFIRLKDTSGTLTDYEWKSRKFYTSFHRMAMLFDIWESFISHQSVAFNDSQSKLAFNLWYRPRSVAETLALRKAINFVSHEA